MHESSLVRMEWFVNHYNLVERFSPPVRILDVGSCDVNGSYKQFFPVPQYIYTGLDVSPGPNVDFCPTNPYLWKELSNASFDVVVSGQAFEHIEFFWATMAEMARVLRPAGLMCILAPWYYQRHRYPVDCYRFDADGMVALARYTGLEPLHASMNQAPANAHRRWYNDILIDCMLVARKPENWSGGIDLETYSFFVPDLTLLSDGFVSREKNQSLQEKMQNVYILVKNTFRSFIPNPIWNILKMVKNFMINNIER